MTRKFASTMFTLGLVGLAACGDGGGRRTVTLGIAGPLSAANGVSMKLAAEMAAAEINASGGINGDSLVLVFGDDEADPQKAIEVAVNLKRNREVVAVVGHVNSSTSLRAATIYNASDSTGAPVLQISPASSSPALTQAGDWTFRVTPTDLEFSPVLARYARQLGRSQAAVLYANDDYGQGVRQTFETAFRGDGGRVVSADPYLPAVLENGTELDPYLRRAIGRGADALVIGGQAEAGVKIIQAARRLGYTGPILGSDGLTGIKDAGAVAEGVFVSSAFLPDRQTEQARRFVAAYRERYNMLPDHRGAMTYDIIHLLRDAILEAGTDRQGAARPRGAHRDGGRRPGARGRVRHHPLQRARRRAGQGGDGGRGARRAAGDRAVGRGLRVGSAGRHHAWRMNSLQRPHEVSLRGACADWRTWSVGKVRCAWKDRPASPLSRAVCGRGAGGEGFAHSATP